MLFLPEQGTVLYSVVGLPILILAIVWCQADADERGRRISKPMKVCPVLFFMPAFPIYIFQTRGLSGFKTLFRTAMLAVAMIACMYAVAFAAVAIGYAVGLVE